MHGRDRNDISDSCDGLPGEADAGENALNGLGREVVAIESGCGSAEDQLVVADLGTKMAIEH
jgi:hypothetical protein